MAIQTQLIPLFPLDVVLFPGMVLPLHIFEPRYRKMVRDCVTSGEGFGLIWAEGETLDLDTAAPLVGTKALLTEVTALPDGRYNINTVGSERFVVRAFSFDEPYLLGHVEPYPAAGANSRVAHAAAPPLAGLLRRYLDLLSGATQQEISVSPMPDDPMTLAFVAAILYQCQNWRKQELLAIPTIPDLMHRIIELLQVENALTQQGLELRDQDRLPVLIEGSLMSFGLN